MLQDLEVYRQMNVLVQRLADIVPNFPKKFRFVFGDKLIFTGLDCIKYISLANYNREERLYYLNQFMAHFDYFKSIFRICENLKIVSVRQSVEIAKILDAIGKQANGWRKAANTSPTTRAAKFKDDAGESL